MKTMYRNLQSTTVIFSDVAEDKGGHGSTSDRMICCVQACILPKYYSWDGIG